MLQEIIHPKICKKLEQLEEWYLEKTRRIKGAPFYSSFDLRDSGSKIAPVDANIFPAGFNNICQVDKDHAPDRVKRYFKHHWGSNVPKKIALVTEEHTNNLYYWDNVATLKELLEQGDFEVQIFLPSILEAPITLTSASGKVIKIFSSGSESLGCDFGDFKPDLVISNNDFSKNYDQWINACPIVINPSYKLGWHVRKKSQFFVNYNRLVGEFARIIGEEPNTFSIITEPVEFDINSLESRKTLAERVDAVISKIKSTASNPANTNPYVFVKNNSGTYGLGVIQVNSGQEVLDWTYRERKKMKAVKGGGKMTEVIIQEGIPTSLRSAEASAEPAIYMIGHELAGGFLRTHSSRNEKESLNSPGAVFQRLCVSDLSIDVEGNPMENCYGWIAKVGHLAILDEFEEISRQETNIEVESRS